MHEAVLSELLGSIRAVKQIRLRLRPARCIADSGLGFNDIVERERERERERRER